MLFILGALASFGSGLGGCTGKCAEPIRLYDYLKCTPVYSSTDDCCPSKYNCLNTEENNYSNEAKCYFEGKRYAPGEAVDNDDIYGNCKVGCTCTSGDAENSKPYFKCPILDCPEWIGYLAEPGCYLTYELGKCCSTGKICTNSPKTCEVNGETVNVGIQFQNPTDNCSECICQEGFKGEFKEPFCRKTKCIEEILKQKEVYSFCAPSYVNYDDCCPIYWFCPEESDKIERATTTSENKCKFGSSLLNIGDKFSRKHGINGELKVTCECRIPPYMTCIQNYGYRW